MLGTQYGSLEITEDISPTLVDECARAPARASTRTRHTHAHTHTYTHTHTVVTAINRNHNPAAGDQSLNQTVFNPAAGTLSFPLRVYAGAINDLSSSDARGFQ